MTKGLAQVIKELIPTYQTQIEDYSSLTNEYYHLKSEAEKGGNIGIFGANDAPIDKASGEIQEKHHSLMEMIRKNGNLRSIGNYKLTKSDADKVLSEVNDLIDLCEDEKNRLKRNQLYILSFFSALIALVVITAFITAF